MDMIKEMLDDWLGRLTLGLIVLLLVMIPAAIYRSIQEQKAWEAFAAQHDCKVVGRMSGSTIPGVGLGVSPSGDAVPVVTMSTTTDKTGYACNDGVTYWR